MIRGDKMKLTVLDAKTLGDDLSLEPLKALGKCEFYPSTLPEQVAERIAESDTIIVNKIKLNGENLKNSAVKLICVAATGYDNIDTHYCRENNIAVCNVEGYSSHSVAQLTLACVLSLSTHLRAYNDYVKSGEYTESGIANMLSPAYYELFGKTWGIIGYGNIGREVGEVAKALGCKLLVCKRTPVCDAECADIDELCKRADIITVHLPLNDATREIINEKRISLMKSNVILVNAARGSVTDEKAISEAVKSGKIGAFACDVYSAEPFPKSHPFYEIKDFPNVLLTPHMAWGAYEARKRCLDEIVKNIEAFENGGSRGRVV